MEYLINNKLKDINILKEILQNRFTKFNDSMVEWKFNGQKINSEKLEEKLTQNYKNKRINPSNDEITYIDWIDLFDFGLNKIKLFNKQPILFFSGGKDSTFIASRLKENKIEALYYSYCQNNNEKNLINNLAEKLKIKVFFTPEKLQSINFEEVLKKIKEPVLDPAGLSVLRLLDISQNQKLHFKDLLFIDGMGNDSYMGHLPGKNELNKLFFQKNFSKINLRKIIPLKILNSIGKFGDLFRPDYTAHFPGSTIKLNNYFDQISFYSKYTIFKNIVIQRALQRGIHYDFCSAINKSILYADACEEKSQIYFPFLNENLIDYFEKRKVLDYDYSKLINKLSIRKYLNENLNYNDISKEKGIFKPTYFDFKYDKNQKDLANKINIPLNNLNIMQISDFYLWSKYIINNKIDYI